MSSIHEHTMNALQSDGFAPIVRAIKERYPCLAEAMLMDAEVDFTEHEGEYSEEERIGIRLAFEECEKRIDHLHTLNRHGRKETEE